MNIKRGQDMKMYLFTVFKTGIIVIPSNLPNALEDQSVED